MGRKARRTLVVALCVAASSFTAPSALADDPVELDCSGGAIGPSQTIGPIVTASGFYRCATVRPSIGVIVCLEYNGVIVDCDQDVRTNDDRAKADVSFACLPGIWTVTVEGVATGGPPGINAGLTANLNCDPLSP